MSEPAIAALHRALSHVGNASSLHAQGRLVRREVEESRELIASALGASPSEIIFCGSGTEANNLAIKGTFWSSGKKTIVISAIEHHAVLDPVEWLVEHDGARLITVPVNSDGVINLDALRTIVNENSDIALIAVMHSNNELGTIQPIAEVVKIAGSIPVHTDAVQSFGKVDFNFADLGVTSATVSAHKLGGPLGIAALVLKHGLDITPILHGGGQERDIRSSTLNAPGIVSFAAAVKDAVEHSAKRYKKMRNLRTELIEIIKKAVPDIIVNGDVQPSLPGIANITFPGAQAESLLVLLDQAGICASQGSACSAGVMRPSHVILALGKSEDIADSTLRFSIGPTTKHSDIEHVGNVIGEVVAKARAAKKV